MAANISLVEQAVQRVVGIGSGNRSGIAWVRLRRNFGSDIAIIVIGVGYLFPTQDWSRSAGAKACHRRTNEVATWWAQPRMW